MAEETAESSRIANGEEGGLEASAPTQEPVVTKRRRGRPRKSEKQAAAEEPAAESASPKSSDETEAPAPKRRRGRPRKTEAPAEEQLSLAVPEKTKAITKTRKTSTRKRVKKDVAPAETEATNNVESEAPISSSEPKADKSADIEAVSAAQSSAISQEESRAQEEPRVQEEPQTQDESRAQNSSESTEEPQASETTNAQAEGEQATDERAQRTSHRRRHMQRQDRQNSQRTSHESRGNFNGQNKGRRNRRQNGPDLAAEPSLTMDDLHGMKVAELRAKAAELGVDFVGRKKAELASAVYEAAALAEGFRHVRGILEIHAEGYGFLRTENYMQGPNDAFVFQQTIRSLALRPGDLIEGTVVPGRSNNKFPPLAKVELVNGITPDQARERPHFRDLTPIFPNEPLKLEHGRDSITGRAIDLVSPIGKGQRGLIVSPPKAGKTTVLKNICQAISANNPEVHLICLLVDERPEEVTDMQRSIRGEVVASTFDMPAENHTAVSELVIEHAKRLVEQGEDVVVVLDSITRLARAYNLAQPASGRILSGGVDSAALYPPKRFLGAARNIENGGSLTIIASALIDTGSKMDEVIFEEFKGTGNMELKLDRDLADKRIFPAIDPVASGTRNEELLISAELQPFVWGVRRILANMNNVERAETMLVKSLKATASNEEFLIRSAKKAQQSGFVDAL